MDRSTTCLGLLASLLFVACQATPAPTRHASLASASPAPVPAAGDPLLEPSWVRPEDLASLAIDRAPQERGPSEPYEILEHRFGLSLGLGFLGNFDTTVQVDSGFLVGAILDLEDFLGVEEDNTVARLDANWRFGRRHRADLSVFDINRSGTRTIYEDINIGEITIPAGDVETKFDTLIVKATYRYDFVADQRTRIGASLGLHTMNLDLGLRSSTFGVEESFKATAPLPVLGLHGEYALSERWKLLGSLELLQVDIGTARGYLSDQRLAIEHEPFEHFGWGLGFNGFKLDAQVEDGPLTADMEYDYQGVFLYLRTFF